jgi:hypothetical protein
MSLTLYDTYALYQLAVYKIESLLYSLLYSLMGPKRLSESADNCDYSCHGGVLCHKYIYGLCRGELGEVLKSYGRKLSLYSSSAQFLHEKTDNTVTNQV